MTLAFEAEWETLHSGSREERACFAALGIRSQDSWLTTAHDAFVQRLRSKVHLSAYHLAEWLAWNFWRLRCEPRTAQPDWPLAHRLTTIGGGYVWPNITIFSDGERIALLAKPTRLRPQEPLRYVADQAIVVQASEFEHAVDLFIQQVRGQLLAEGLATTNLHAIWEDVLAERRDRQRATLRTLEALLGFDPDEAEPGLIAALTGDAQAVGQRAIQELAAAATRGTGDGPHLFSAAQLQETARASGFDTNPSDAVRLVVGTPLSQPGVVPAWKRGAEAARALRSQQQLGTAPIPNDRLAELAGVPARILTDRTVGPSFSFALDHSASSGRVVLRSKWETGCRFEVARLLGDRFLGSGEEPLLPATRAATYRQKAQRSFAAELLCPIEALTELLSGDFSSESTEDAAARFHVSERTVLTLLGNHGLIDRESLDEDFVAASVW